jgi:glycosyltransferase involved in cell wall biosynthesis
MLVPHEPNADPRIAWVTALCREKARTDIYAATWTAAGPAREYDGRVYTERLSPPEYMSRRTKFIWKSATRLLGLGPARRFADAEANDRRAPQHRALRGWYRALDYHIGALLVLVGAWGYYWTLVTALYRRSRSVSVRPTLIVVHDIFALVAGIRLRRHLGARLLYDSHEFWPEAELLAPRWQHRLLARVERRLVRGCDAVVTVSPQLAAHLRDLYGLDSVISAPNAEPRRVEEDWIASPHDPVRFLLQGQVAPGRGIDLFIQNWIEIDDARTVLWIRAPRNAYLDRLVARFATYIERGRIEILEPVPERELVAAAAAADVGVIPYRGPNLNHVYASPNKLSQFMAAGLAILSGRLDYVTSVVTHYDCGEIFDVEDTASLALAIDRLVSDPEYLHAQKRNAYEGARETYNWETLSRDYDATIERLLKARHGRTNAAQ